MKNQIIPLNSDSKLKVFGYTDEQIIVSSKGHKTIDSLIASTEKSGMMETIRIIPVNSVQELFFNEKEDAFTIRYDKNGKTKKETVLLDDVSLRAPLVAQIAELKEFKEEVLDESKTKPLLLNLLGVIAIPIATWIFRGMAIDAQNGEHYEATGRRSGLKQLLADAVEWIGPTGIIIIGILGLIYMLYVTYNRYSNPASEVKYS